MRAILLSPAFSWRHHRKHLFSFTATVEESTMSFCNHLMSGSKRTTLAKRRFIASPQRTTEEHQKRLLALKISETAMQSYYVQLNTCVVESILLIGDRKTKESCQLLHEVQCFQRTWFIHISDWLNWEAVFPIENAWPGYFFPSFPLLLCLHDQYLTDRFHKNIKLSIGDRKLLRLGNRVSKKLL